VLCFFLGEGLRRTVWRRGIASFVKRSQPLILAIGEYNSREGRPPDTLASLVPGFLPGVPETGFGVSGRYIYLVGDGAKRYSDNPWALRVSVPSLPMGFDQMLYVPKQNYPAFGYGGSLERFDGWAYVHE